MPRTFKNPASARPARTRWASLLALALALALASGARAQVIALLSSDAAPYAAAEAGLREALQGTVVRRLVVDENTKASLAALAAKADAVVAIGGPAAALCHDALGPKARFFYCMVADPGSLGLATDQRAQGITTDVPDEAEVRAIAEALPGAMRVGLLYDSTNPASKGAAERFTGALRPGWTAVATDVSTLPSRADAINRLLDSGIDVVWTAPDPAVYSAVVIKTLLLDALRHKTPVYGFSSQFVRAGALLGTGIDPAEQGRQAAELIRGAGAQRQPAAGPSVHPPRHLLFVNTVVAEQIGVRLPQSLLDRADAVYSGGEK